MVAGLRAARHPEECFFIIDLDRPIADRIVWTKGEIHQDAHRWLAMLGQLLRSTGLSPNSWEEKERGN